MGDLISRSALIGKLTEKAKKQTEFIAELAFFESAKMAQEMPTVEAEPVVHCKDCVYWGNVHATGETEKVRACEIFLRLTHECWFCSNGAKMDSKSKV